MLDMLIVPGRYSTWPGCHCAVGHGVPVSALAVAAFFRSCILFAVDVLLDLVAHAGGPSFGLFPKLGRRATPPTSACPPRRPSAPKVAGAREPLGGQSRCLVRPHLLR